MLKSILIIKGGQVKAFYDISDRGNLNAKRSYDIFISNMTTLSYGKRLSFIKGYSIYRKRCWDGSGSQAGVNAKRYYGSTCSKNRG